ncbi:MAG: hypothetical protein IKU05_05270 [Bacteroidales bacterium]|nr:hypothetical protein [Bacteroidales bacterium]MBR6438013.1 hypothetical protein [Bacteroidales bacterium]
MVQKIQLTGKQTCRRLAKTFKVSVPYVSMALSFQRNGELANKIRSHALQNGGKLLQEAEVKH